MKRQEELGLPILNKVKEIIDYFKPTYYFIENPLSGRMKDYMTEYKHTDVCYCMYGFDYKKPTRIWHNNAELDFALEMCTHKGKHTARIGKRGSTTLNQRYSIPPKLIEQVFRCVICDEPSEYNAIPWMNLPKSIIHLPEVKSEKQSESKPVKVKAETTVCKGFNKKGKPCQNKVKCGEFCYLHKA